MRLQEKSISIISRNTMGLLVIMALLLFFLAINVTAEVPERYKIDNPEGHGEIFLGGVYIYGSCYGDVETMDAHLRYLAQSGVKHVYLTSSSRTDPTTYQLIDMCMKYGLYISFQIENAYISTVNDFTIAKAQMAANFINSYDTPTILAYTVREEPPSNNTDNFIDRLLNHYNNITSYCFGYDFNNPAPMYLLHGGLTAIEDANDNITGQQPVATGTDRYFARWHFSDIGYIATPSKVLELQAGGLGFPPFREGTNSNQYFTAVFTSSIDQITYAKSYLQATYPDKYSRWLTLAQDNNQGLSEDGDNIKVWSYYRPPQNLTRATMWQTIAFGSHGIMNWACSPRPGTSSFNGLMGNDFKGGNVFEEYTSTIRELQPYAWLINRMDISAINGVSTDPDSYVWKGNFTLGGYDTHIAVVVNGDVGSWANNSKTSWLTTNQPYHIDSNGELIDYVPCIDTRTLTITNQQPGLGSMYDLATGQLIGNNSGTITLEPGQGKFIWIGNQSDMEEVRLLCGFTGLTKLVGYMNYSAELPKHIRSIWPIDGFHDSSAYIVKSQTIDLDRRYRLHITASSSDGAQLGSYLSLYNSSWQTIGGYQIGIWNKPLSLTPQTFTSNEFRAISAEAAHTRIHFYRSNKSGTLNIQDAWIEDIEHHGHITTYYKNYLSAKLAPNKTYRVHVVARKLPNNYENSGLGILCHNYRTENGSSVVYQSVNKYWKLTALTSNPNEFVSNTFTAYDGQATFLTVGIYNIHYNRDSGETAVIEKAWVEEVIP